MAERIDYITQILRARRDKEMISLPARHIPPEFDAYYAESRELPAPAQRAFE